MLEKPRNYEEARVIIENAVDDEKQTKETKMVKIRFLSVLGIGIAASVVAGVMNENLIIGVAASANALMIASPFAVPYFHRKKVINAIHDGSYFEKADKDNVMDAAIDYVREYNEYEEKKGKNR